MPFKYLLKFKQRSNSRRSSSSQSTNGSEIEMSTNQDSVHPDEASTSNALDQEGSNVDSFDEELMPGNDSDLTNKSGELVNDEVQPDNDNDHLDLSGELDERSDDEELGQNGVGVPEHQRGNKEETRPGNSSGEPIESSDGKLGQNGVGVSKQQGRNEERRPGKDTIVDESSTDDNSRNIIALPPAKSYIRYIPVLPTTKQLESPSSSKYPVAQPPMKTPMSVGPFGSPRGSAWDDGVYCGVKSIKLGTGWIVDSIIIEYIDQNGDIYEKRHGGNGGSKYVVELDYPDEYIISIWGYYGRIIEENEMFVRSLTFQTNKRTHGPFGVEEGRYFSFPTTGGKVIGFHGRADSYLNAIGAYMELPSYY